MTNSEPPSFEVRAYRAGDEHAILETFNRVFAKVDPSFVPRTLAEWRWQYEQNPSGLRAFLCATPEGRVLAQYAGSPQRVLIEGQPTHFSQSIDSMSDPELRRGLTREPLFVQAGKAYDASYGGAAPDKDTLMWGFPVPVAWRIGKRQLKYEYMRTQDKLVIAPEALRRLRDPAARVEIERAAAIPAEFDAFFASCAAEHACIAVRDRAQLRWRFELHPRHRYEIGIARRAGAICGLAVFRAGHYDGAEDGLLCDWLVPRNDGESSIALLAWLGERAQAAGCARVAAVFPDTSPEWLGFQQAGWRVRGTRYFLVGWSFSRKHNLRWLYRHWYYTLGDSDLC